METIFTNIRNFFTNLSGLFICLLSFAVLAEILFGGDVLGMSVIANVIELIELLGSNGVVGVIALVILYELLSRK